MGIERVCLLQARMGSSRLPGKVLEDLAGRPMLERQIERLRACRRIGAIVVVTSVDPRDAAIVELSARVGVGCFAGSEEDVLDRYYRAAAGLGAVTVFRVTGDCPLIDPDIVDSLAELFFRGGLDYATTGGRYPDGLDAEVFTFATLETAWREARLASEREHVTPFVWKQPSRFRLGGLSPEADLSSHRWTVDEPRDLEFVRAVYANLHREGHVFRTAEILDLLSRVPSLRDLNQGIGRNEGYARSVARERARRP